MSSEWPAPTVLGRPVVAKQGTCIARVGAEVRQVHLIADGVVGRWASDNVLDAARTAGWLLGAVPAMTTGRYEANLTALTACTLCPVPVAIFLELLGTLEVSTWVNEMLAADLLAEARRRAAIARRGTRAMVEALLVELMSVAGRKSTTGGLKLAIPLTSVDVASLVGVSREHGSRVISELVAEGYVTRDKGWFVAPPGSPLLHRIDSGEP
jgi:CRP-like cAMP-binding protein